MDPRSRHRNGMAMDYGIGTTTYEETNNFLQIHKFLTVDPGSTVEFHRNQCRAEILSFGFYTLLVIFSE